MSQFKKILVNKYEQATDTALNRIAQKHSSRVFPKVRVADVLPIDNSGISKEHFSYALKAHFDFVFAKSDGEPRFAVEFDEAHHFTDPATIRRDQLKNSLCDFFSFPILRIDEMYLARVGNFAAVLDWVIEMRFAQEAFYEAQEKGQIPFDEVFIPAAIFEWGYYHDGQFVPVNHDELTTDEVKRVGSEQGKQLSWRPYDPFSKYQGYINKLALIENFCSLPNQEFNGDAMSVFQSAMSYVQLPNERFIYGDARCHANFPFVEGLMLAYELASVDLARKIIQYRKGIDTSCSRTELEAMKIAVKRNFPA